MGGGSGQLQHSGIQEVFNLIIMVGHIGKDPDTVSHIDSGSCHGMLQGRG
jgi:hypothetical protein